MENVSRNKVHELALQAMYSFLIIEDLKMEIDIEEAVTTVCNQESFEDCDDYLKLLLIKSLKNQTAIIDTINPYLKNWKFTRLNYCIQAILILAVAEYSYIGEIDKAIVINTSVKLAKKYGESKDYRFVNALLDNCLK